ncbi:MAG: hypothetical protein ACAH12_07805 [Methylophilaceae bacterium]
MSRRFLKQMLFSVLIALAVSGCGSMKIWPLSSDTTEADPRTPANSTEYQCDKNKKFYVRTIDKGAAVWVILSNREFSLAKDASGRYTNSIATLTLDGDTAVFDDGYKSEYLNCKTQSNKSK